MSNIREILRRRASATPAQTTTPKAALPAYTTIVLTAQDNGEWTGHAAVKAPGKSAYVRGMPNPVAAVQAIRLQHLNQQKPPPAFNPNAQQGHGVLLLEPSAQLIQSFERQYGSPSIPIRWLPPSQPGESYAYMQRGPITWLLISKPRLTYPDYQRLQRTVQDAYSYPQSDDVFRTAYLTDSVEDDTEQTANAIWEDGNVFALKESGSQWEIFPEDHEGFLYGRFDGIHTPIVP